MGGGRTLDEAAPEQSETPAVADAERGDGTLVVAVRRLPESLDPMADLDPWGQRVVDVRVFEGVVRAVGASAPFVEPALADDCVLVPAAAPKHAWCHLRADQRFHDGAAVTPQDVHDALSAWLDPRRDALRARHGLDALRRVELADGPPSGARAGARADPGKWVHIEVDRAEPLLLERIAAMKVWPKGKRRGSGFSRAPIGTGPMRVASFDAESLVLEAAPQARRSAAVARLRLETVTDGAQALVRLRRGDVHLAFELPAAFVPRELGKPGMAARFSAWLLTPPRYDLLLYNVRKGPLASRELRAALDRALPRVALARAQGAMPAASVRAPVDTLAPVEIDLAGLHEAKAAADWGAHGLPARARRRRRGHHPLRRPRSSTRSAGASIAAYDGARTPRCGWCSCGTAPVAAQRRDRQRGATRVAARGRDGAAGDRQLRVPAGAHARRQLRRRARARLSTATDADLWPYFHRRGPAATSPASPTTSSTVRSTTTARRPTPRRGARPRPASPHGSKRWAWRACCSRPASSCSRADGCRR
ncbi:MAG: ABC transporter substrate-binding protein [Nannocystaceae bacterium]